MAFLNNLYFSTNFIPLLRHDPSAISTEYCMYLMKSFHSGSREVEWSLALQEFWKLFFLSLLDNCYFLRNCSCPVSWNFTSNMHKDILIFEQRLKRNFLYISGALSHFGYSVPQKLCSTSKKSDLFPAQWGCCTWLSLPLPVPSSWNNL